METSPRWQRIKELFQSALEREPEHRSAFLAEVCADDLSLKAELESLLSSFELADSFLPTRPMGSAADSGNLVNPEVWEGQSVGAYKLIRPLAHGGMGIVLLAVRADEQFQKRVAIKLIKRGMDSAAILRRFRNERQILAGLDHPYIARLLDGGTTEAGLPYFVMEYIEGQPIDEYCDARKLSITERLILFRKACAAVQYAHQNLVVHRDIKPGNILVTAEGEPKLLDFGIAKLLNPEMSSLTIDPTIAELRLMTPDYASPEQVRGETITTASDVYSLGVVLYELLTGHKPYQLPSRQLGEIAQIICDKEPEKLSSVVNRTETIAASDGNIRKTVTSEAVSRTREGYPAKLRRRLAGDLDNIVLMAIRKEVQRRYASVEQFSEDIRRHLEGMPVIARRDTLTYRTAKFIKRNRAGVSAAALIVLSLLGGMMTTAWQARIAGAQRAKAEQRFNDVRHLANSFLFEFHDAIEKLPGATPARALLVQRALEYLDKLAQEARDDRSLSRELASAYERVGNIQGNPYSANLGDTAGALQSYRKALAIREQVLADDAQNAQAGLELAITCSLVSDILAQTHDMAGALENAQRALQIREALATKNPRSEQVRIDLGRSYEQLGEILSRNGDDSSAQEKYQKALQIREELAAANPANTVNRRGLAIMYSKISAMLMGKDDSVGALDNAQKAQAIFQALSVADPLNTQARRELAFNYNRMGDLLWQLDRVTEALENYRQSQTIHEALSAADSTNIQARHDLAISYGNVGYAQVEVGNAEDGLQSYGKSLTIFEGLAAADPSNIAARRDLAVSYSLFGNVYMTLASKKTATSTQRAMHAREAKSWYQRSLSVFQGMQAQGLLRGSDSERLDKITRRIADCDALIK